MKIYIAILNQGWIRPELSNVILQMFHQPEHELHIEYPNDRPIPNNRNKIVERFLESKFDYLLMIDSDVVPRRNPLDLVALDKDVISMPCPQWREGDLYWVVMDKDGEKFKPQPPKKRSGLKKVDAVGTGCILIARRVLEKFPVPFQDVYEDGSFKLGEDFNFCKKIRNDFEIWANWDYNCDHWKTVSLIDVLKLLTEKK